MLRCIRDDGGRRICTMFYVLDNGFDSTKIGIARILANFC